MKEKLVSTIEAEKEVLSVMPLKTKKNKVAYLEALKKLETKYKKQEKEFKGEITLRSNKIKDIKESPEINEVTLKINEVNEELFLINKYLDSFSKLGLDRVIYGLNHFYKDNLIRVNKLILKAINIFKDVGIELTPAYFDYSHYTYDYMQVFFKEMDNDIKSDLIRDTFENIYWKCPDIITHLDLNIRYLYYLNKEAIDKYFETKKTNFLAKENIDEDKIRDNYNILLRRKDSLVAEDAATILKDFVTKKVSLVDYSESKITKNYDKLIIDKEYFEQNKDYTNLNIIKLENSLREYQNYMAFKFVIDDIKKRFGEKDSYKNLLKNKLKEITKLEDDLRKKNFKIYKMKSAKIPDKNGIEAALNETEPKVLELKQKYVELEEISFNDKVLNLINNNSSYYDVLCLASANYNYLTDTIRNNEKDISEDDIKLKVYKLLTFVNSPYNTIINNINIMDEKDIENIIIERYRLLNLEINKENMAEEGIEDLISTVHSIVSYIHVMNSSITLDNIIYVVNALPITNPNK